MPSELFIGDAVEDFVSTGVDAEMPVAGQTLQDNREAWQVIIDRKLVEWGCNPTHFADEGLEPPTRLAITNSIEWARSCRNNGIAPPDRVVLDPNGGIVFERHENDLVETMHFWDDGTTEYRTFRNAVLNVRRVL